MSDRHDTLPEEFYLSDFEEFFVGVDTARQNDAPGGNAPPCHSPWRLSKVRRAAAGQGTEPHDSGCLWCAAPGAGAYGRSGDSTTTTWSRRRGPLGFMAAQRGPDSPSSRNPSSQEILFGSPRVSGGDERGGHYHRAGSPEKSGGRVLPMTRSRSLGSARLCYRLCLD